MLDCIHEIVSYTWIIFGSRDAKNKAKYYVSGYILQPESAEQQLFMKNLYFSRKLENLQHYYINW